MLTDVPRHMEGFTINGEVEEGHVLRKGGLRAGDLLVLTKPLGTGCLLAAAMKGKAKGRLVLSKELPLVRAVIVHTYLCLY